MTATPLRLCKTCSEAPVRDALAYPGPALVHVNVNADEPPMPGKIAYAQQRIHRGVPARPAAQARDR